VRQNAELLIVKAGGVYCGLTQKKNFVRKEMLNIPETHG
jgi:hypothetical protein